MIKSDKEMKNNNIRHSNILKPPIKCHICEYRERYALRRIRTPVKSNDSGQM